MGQTTQYPLVYPNALPRTGGFYRDGIAAVKSELRGRSFRLVAISGRHQESAVSKSQTTTLHAPASTSGLEKGPDDREDDQAKEADQNTPQKPEKLFPLRHGTDTRTSVLEIFVIKANKQFGRCQWATGT
jgi:hypothetical protein